MSATPRPPAALVAARKRHAEARERVERIDTEVTKLRDALDAASRARESAKSALRSGESLPPALAQAVGESLALTEVLADEQASLAEALRDLTDCEADLAHLERAHALAVAAAAERDLAPQLVAALANLHAVADALEDATRDAVDSARDPFERRYFWTRGDRARPHELHSVAREAWREAARVTAGKLADMGLTDAVQSVRKGTA